MLASFIASIINKVEIINEICFAWIKNFKLGFIICLFIYLPMKIGFEYPWFNSHLELEINEEIILSTFITLIIKRIWDYKWFFSLGSNHQTWIHDLSVHLFPNKDRIWNSDFKFSLSAIDKWGNIAFKFHCYNYQQILHYE